MDDDERDVEIFERIPWDSLEKKSDRRWMSYAAAAVIVLGAVGVTIGRGAASSSSAMSTTPSTIASQPSVPSSSISNPTSTLAADSTLPAEADLMALTVGTVEAGAMTAAEWFVVDWFTRDGTDDNIPGRSFVDWAGATSVEWTTTTQAEVTVLIRRLAVLDAGPYQRLPDEGWRVAVELTDRGWIVTEGPVPAEAPPVEVDVAAPSGEWEDAAGLVWSVSEN